MNGKSSSLESINLVKAIILSASVGFFGIILYASQSTQWKEFFSIFGVALLIASASLLAGWLLGFLFGIPRSLQQDDPGNDVIVAESNSMGENKGGYRANTNLEQISDWLTKILVGVGLTQITSLPEAISNYAEFTSLGLGDFPNNKIFAVAILVYFLISGFLLGYIWTRLFFAPALRQADIAALGGELKKVVEKVSERERQEAIDLKALNLIRGYLDPSPGAPPIAKGEKELQNILEAVIIPSSSEAKRRIFYLAHQMRSENWHDPKRKPKMERTIPVFKALISSDEKEVFHRNFAQLGYALKDKSKSTHDDLLQAEKCLTKAIDIRGSWEDNGFLFYELNRAICQIMLDENFKKGKKSEKENQQMIFADLNAARHARDLNNIIKSEPLFVKWTKLNGSGRGKR